MNREQFIAQLARLLQDLPPAERQEAIRYYQEYFDDAGEENEDAVIQELGSPGNSSSKHQGKPAVWRIDIRSE